KPIPEALFRLGEAVADGGTGAFLSARRVLLNEPPALLPGTAWTIEGEDAVHRACRLALALDHTTLAIQGPPGSGKTYTGARIVRELVKAGKRVGVVATGHKTIRHFLDEVGRSFSSGIIHKITTPSDDLPDWLTETTSNDAVRAALLDGT